MLAMSKVTHRFCRLLSETKAFGSTYDNLEQQMILPRKKMISDIVDL